jgi:aspartate 1-decarboxylase
LHRCFLGAKLHRFVITEADPDYVGSITLDRDLLEFSGILPGERVQVAGLESGARFETYVMEGPSGSGMVCINGPAALLVEIGERVIVLQYLWLDPDSCKIPEPRVIMADDRNLNPYLLHS